MKLNKKNYYNFMVQESVKVDKTRVIENYILNGIGLVKAEELAEHDMANLKKLVSSKYQYEVDYYLEYNKPSETEIGQEITRLKVMYLNRFFDTLTAIAMQECFND